MQVEQSSVQELVITNNARSNRSKKAEHRGGEEQSLLLCYKTKQLATALLTYERCKILMQKLSAE
jgi:hypothetical protein